MASRLLIVVLGIPLVWLALTAGEVSRFILFGLVSVLGQAELFRLLSPDQELPRLEAAGGLAILFATSLAGERGLLLGFALALVGLGCLIVLRGLDGRGYQRFALGTVSLAYLPFCLGFFLLLARSHGPTTLFALLVTVWALDIGAYAVGMSLRGPALAPRISPKKTVSGAVGGLAATAATVWGLGAAGVFVLPPWRLAALAAGIGVIGQVADLFESVLKREARQKDSGSLLGAHGGILDRVDSLLLVGPVAFLLLTL
ncbi:MAG: phosphatidate cytidylyltransferase [Candidatus Riflebacteria bacterium]|nr:phosphatidate cytidylyltransferase [Candidatus Riflebacteria bacterium]